MWETVRCRHCHSRVPSIAIYCPHCNTRMPTPSRFSARTFIVPFWLLLALIIGGAGWYLFGQNGLNNVRVQAQGSANAAMATLTPVRPTATPLPGPSSSEVKITITDPHGLKAGQWARLDVAVNNQSSLAAPIVSIRISNTYFDGYHLDSTEPTVIRDHVEADGLRYLDLPGIPPKTSGVYHLNLQRTNGTLPIEAKLQVATQSGVLFEQILRP